MGLRKHRDATLEFRVLGSGKLTLGPRSYPRKCSFKATFCHRVVVKAADGIGTATRMAYGQLQTKLQAVQDFLQDFLQSCKSHSLRRSNIGHSRNTQGTLATLTRGSSNWSACAWTGTPVSLMQQGRCTPLALIVQANALCPMRWALPCRFAVARLLQSACKRLQVTQVPARQASTSNASSSSIECCVKGLRCCALRVACWVVI